MLGYRGVRMGYCLYKTNTLFKRATNASRNGLLYLEKIKMGAASQSLGVLLDLLPEEVFISGNRKIELP